MKKFLGICALWLVLTGCGTTKPTRGAGNTGGTMLESGTWAVNFEQSGGTSLTGFSAPLSSIQCLRPAPPAFSTFTKCYASSPTANPFVEIGVNSDPPAASSNLAVFLSINGPGDFTGTGAFTIPNGASGTWTSYECDPNTSTCISGGFTLTQSAN